MVCVRPGVLLVRARCFRPASALMALDLPTFERPAKASSGGPAAGRSAARPAARQNTACEKTFMMGLEILIKSRLSDSEGRDDPSNGARRGGGSRSGRAGIGAGPCQGAGDRRAGVRRL